MEEVFNFLNSLDIKKESKIIVAVSYGPDSMALLDILKNKYNASNVICAHVHHNHRKESDLEKVNLEKYCLNNNIIFEYMKIKSYEDNKFTEEKAREIRYKFFESILNKYNSKYLFTAHHGDDLTETILMRLTRGSSIEGYSGISLVSKRKNYDIIRPLLFINKEEILRYCKDNDIIYAVDKSNFSDNYTRNRYRKYILPKLKEENKNVHKKFLEFSQNIKQIESYINKQVDDVYSKVYNEDYIDISHLKNMDLIIIKKVIMKYLFSYYKNDIKKINNTHVNQIIRVINSNKPNMIIKLPNKINLIKSYNKIYFDKEKIYNDYCFLFKNYLSLNDGYCIKKISDTKDKSNNVIMLNKDDIALPLYIRNKTDGDVMEVLNLNGKKKIKDIFIDEKIPKEKRNNYPILVDSNGTILWIPGIKKSKYDKSKKGNYDIIIRYQKEEI